MKVINFEVKESVHAGLLKDDAVYQIDRLPGFKGLDTVSLISLNSLEKEKLIGLVSNSEIHYKLQDVKLKAPILKPSKYLAIGLNYQKHVDEVKAKGLKIPKHQLWFNKQVSCINGPYDDIEMPLVSSKLDYEGEMAFVISKECRHIKAEKAADYIGGYFVCNDVSVRDWQMHSPTFTMGKSFDSHGPIGPWIVTPDEIEDPHNLDIEVWVNDEVRQKSNTSDMIYNCFEQIEYLSKAFTLMPGDIIATGTPAGVGIGTTPPVYLKTGDRVKVEIEGLGYIENKVVDEPAR